MLYTHDTFLKLDNDDNSYVKYIEFFDKYSNEYIKDRLLENNSFDQEIFELLTVMLNKLHVYRISIHGLKKHKLLTGQEN